MKKINVSLLPFLFPRRVLVAAYSKVTSHDSYRYSQMKLAGSIATMLAAIFCCALTGSAHALMAMTDNELSQTTGQALFWSDVVSGSELAGANAYSKPFNFYRVGLDGELGLNTNIGKLQLGCGGVNDFLNSKAACDIDIDYASLMGRSGTNVGLPGSAFVLKRPYLEFAIKNDDNPVKREVVGMKIGAASADGAITAGRRYATGQTNQETITTSTCQPGNVGAGVGACHSGINSVSGFLGAEMSLQMDATATVCTTGSNAAHTACNFLSIPIDLGLRGCVGRLTGGNGTDASGGSCNHTNNPLFLDIGGTRMTTMGLKGAKLDFQGNGLAGVINAATDSLYASLTADLILVHKLTFENTSDFFISLQREPVAYPSYTKRTPAQDITARIAAGETGIYDVCNSSSATARCNSAYSVPANTGWWLNAPSVKLLDVNNTDAFLGYYGLTQVLPLFAAPGLALNNAEFNLTPGKNCYGSSRFC
ncbi:MAG: hypothetical protein ACRERR_10320 [Moraxellaceae bacterium]